MDVLVRPGPRGVMLGPRPAAPAGIGPVSLRGVQALVDPTAPDALPLLVVADPDKAADALDLLLGPGAVDAVRDPSGATMSVEPDPRVAAALRTLGLTRWLEAHSPDLLPTWLLDVEGAVAAAVLADALVESEAEEASSTLRTHAGRVVEAARAQRAGDSVPTGGPELVLAALGLLRDDLPLTDPLHDEVEHEVELAAALRSFGAPRVLDWTQLGALATVAGRGRGPSDVDRSEGWAGRRAASVDWWQVPRGILRTEEDTVRWEIVDGGARVEVVVEARPGATAAGLGFRLYLPGGPGGLPAATGPLTPTADGTSYEGSATLLAPPAVGGELDVHTPGSGRPPRLGVEATTARGMRWSVRAVTALRLGGTGAVDTVSMAMSQASSAFGRVGQNHPEEAERRRAARRSARTQAVSVAAIRQDERRALAPRAAGPVAESDVATPDLGGSGWRPLVAESALGADPVWSR